MAPKAPILSLILLLHVYVHSIQADISVDDECNAAPYFRNNILENRFTNHGLAFSTEQRNDLQINGLLPYGYRSIELQSKLVMNALSEMQNDLDKYSYLMTILETNIKLFYYTLINNIQPLMPIVYTPVVGAACLELGYVLNRFDHGLWLTIHDIDNVERILSQWPNKDKVKGIVVTDGERILGLGDLGAFGMGIPIGKIALYTAIGGIPPSQLLPILIDVGTNNQKLLQDPYYFGIKETRTTFQDRYDLLMDKFMQSAVNVFGETVLIQFEDFGNSNAFRLLQKYQDKYCMFNDDIQGTAAVTIAGIYASLSGTNGLKKLTDHSFLMVGAGSAGIGIADIITTAIIKETNGEITVEAAREYIWLVDSRGLIFNGRGSGISALKAVYSHDLPSNIVNDTQNMKDIAYIINKLNTTAIIGVSGQAKQFTKEVIFALKENSRYPLIFSLSNPTSKSECTAQEAYDWTENELYFASGSPFDDIQMGDTDIVITPSQGNNAYIFPGVALGIIASQAKRVPDDIFLIAAKCVSDMVGENLLQYGIMYPPINNIREVSVEIAIKVAQAIHERGLTDQITPPDFDLRALVENIQYNHQNY